MKAVFRYPGAKWSISWWIIQHFPEGYEKLCYLEPFAGSAAVFFNKNPSRVETINDLDSNIVNLFRVLRERPEELKRAIELTPYSREEYEQAVESFDHPDPLEKARRYFVRCMQGVGAKSNARGTWRIEPRAYPGGAAKKWCDGADLLMEAAKRLRGGAETLVQIEHTDAIDLIERFNSRDVLMYLDPPYLRSTRRSGALYTHEMTEEGQHQLVQTINRSKAKIIISGYDNDLYNETLGGWHKDSITVMTTSTAAATETIWMNYTPPFEQYSIFGAAEPTEEET